MSVPLARRETAVVVGSGPNGLVAAVTLAEAGWQVTVLEAADVPGGGLRTEALTADGFRHDVCSSVHPLGLGSPALAGLLDDVTWRHPELPLAHPLDGGRAGLLHQSLATTAQGLGRDGARWRAVMEPLVRGGAPLVESVLSPRSVPRAAPLALADFALAGVLPATVLGRLLATDEARALLAGCSAHAMLDLHDPITSGVGLLLLLLAHQVGWPVAEGGSSSIADALVRRLERAGGQVVCGQRVDRLTDIPPAAAVLFDLTPRQVVAIAGDRLPAGYARRLGRYRYGPGVFKVDWALDGPVPWTNPDVHRAATVHLGGDLREIAAAERDVVRGRHPDRPFVLYVQATVADPTRAPAGKHTGWAYCHVPNGSTVDMTDRIEGQLERFAPGFRDLVVGRNVMGPAALEAHDANLVGGDIGGGSADLRQFLVRPTAAPQPWRTPVPGLYLCSSSTPPGAGVHGMCGRHAARLVLKDARRPSRLNTVRDRVMTKR